MAAMGSLCNLHSTMYLFKLLKLLSSLPPIQIYIPPCIYLNQVVTLHQAPSHTQFTFHHVSI